MTDAFDAAWIRSPIRFTAESIAAVEAEALRTYPSECCGFMFGPADEPTKVDECRAETNEADKYHRLDPETFPRTSTTYFKINELRASRTFDEGAHQGRPVKVIFHSHCDSDAAFSAEDSATFSQDGQLMWPCAFLVVAVRDGEVVERRLWQHAPDGTFVEGRFEVLAGEGG